MAAGPPPEQLAFPIPCRRFTEEQKAKESSEGTAESFFQANRFLLPKVATAVIDSVLPEGEVLDLYAGVGLFAVSLAASGRGGVTAVEAPGASGETIPAAKRRGLCRTCDRRRGERSGPERFLTIPCGAGRRSRVVAANWSRARGVARLAQQRRSHVPKRRRL